jgi:predicted Zn-dependent protease
MTEDGAEKRLLVQASALWQSGRPDQAEAILRSLLANNPANVDALVALSELLGAFEARPGGGCAAGKLGRRASERRRPCASARCGSAGQR